MNKIVYTVHVPVGSDMYTDEALESSVGRPARFNGIVTGVVVSARREGSDGKHRLIFEVESDPSLS